MSQLKQVTPADPVSTFTKTSVFLVKYFQQDYDRFLFACVTTGAGEPAVSLNGSPAKGSFPTHSRARSCTSHLPSSTSEPVQTQQPCSLKGSLSSDNIYAGAGLHGHGTGTQAPPGQGTVQNTQQNNRLSANISS